VTKATGFGSNIQNIAAKLDQSKGLFEPFMAVNKGRCLVVTNQKRAQFLEEGVSFNRNKSQDPVSDQIGVLMEKPYF
jgi:hypothetical protein